MSPTPVLCPHYSIQTTLVNVTNKFTILKSGAHPFSVLTFLNPYTTPDTIHLAHPEILSPLVVWHVLISLCFLHPPLWSFYFILLPQFFFLCPHIKCHFTPFAPLFIFPWIHNPLQPMFSTFIWVCRFQINFSHSHLSLGFLLLTSKWMSYWNLNIIVSKWRTSSF